MRTAPEPFRPFFVVGSVLGLLGASVWILYSVWPGVAPSKNGHIGLMIQGFLFSYAAGFLMTAAPRWLAAPGTGRLAQPIVLGGVLASGAGFWLDRLVWAEGAFAVASSALLLWLLLRIKERQAPVGPAIQLCAVALAAGVAGAALRLAYAIDLASPDLGLFGRRLLTEGMMTLLPLGVGSRLGPMLLGIENRSRRWIHPLAGLSILALLVLEHWAAAPVLGFARAGLVALVVFSDVPITTMPDATPLRLAFWTAHRLVAIGTLASVMSKGPTSEGLHVLFIGGLSILIVAIATRVWTEHARLDRVRMERGLVIAVLLFACAMLARIGAPFSAESYHTYLLVAAVLWFAGMLVHTGTRWIETRRAARLAVIRSPERLGQLREPHDGGLSNRREARRRVQSRESPEPS